MAQLLTKQQIRTWLRENNLKTAKSIEDAFTDEIKDVLQEALEEEMTNELGYTKYDWKNKNTSNSRNGHTKKTVKSKFGEIPLNSLLLHKIESYMQFRFRNHLYLISDQVVFPLDL